MPKSKKMSETPLNIDDILFKCRDILRQAKKSGSFFEKRDLMPTLIYAEPEFYRSAGFEEIKENHFSFVPSRYIEFVDRDQAIDYEKVMSESSVKVADILARQKANQTALGKTFTALGYNLGGKK